MSILTHHNRSRLLASAASCLLASLLYAPLTQAIVPNDNNTPEDAVDNDGGVNGVGMFFRNDGFVCTGTLINPRTVLFAAHCVNSNPESDFGTTLRSAFSFNVDSLPGFINWINNGFASNPDLNVFDVNQIFWNPASTARPDSFGFLEGDIALASLAAPAAEIPTWALLFSALPNPGAGDPVTGTGYHVNITGYGRSGSGSTGDSQGIDWRRRAAENMLGALTSFDERNTYLFGNAFGDLPQNLYRIDFDDPNQTNPYDFNAYLDEPLENEGTTAGGDSGGPLILDAANNTLSSEDLVLGVLSGGSRFFGPQGFSSYGTTSFYQPLFLFADYIAANNPYRYVSTLGGDGNWEDSTHWQTDLDPNYRIIDANGNVVNGFPDTVPAGTSDTGGGDFGTVCFDPQGDNIGDGCQDLNNGDAVPPARSIGDVSNNIGAVSVEDLAGAQENSGENSISLAANLILENQAQGGNGVEFAENAPQAGADVGDEQPQAPGDPLPAPTLANGLAGATNFVPDNIDPDIAAGINGRYFDVRLSTAGTTTLSSTRTIDRLTLNGGDLDIASGGDLTSLIDVQQMGGIMNVDGDLTSVGDYLLMTGLLSGVGTIKTPFLTSVAGVISPGEIGGVGTLTIDGSAVLSSGSNLMIDIGANGVNDVFAVSGDASLGGNVWFGATDEVRAGNTYTFLTNTGTQSGSLNGQAISTLLRPVLSYSANSVTATIEAGTYFDAINTNSDVQKSYATLLDGSRAGTSLASLYATLDLSTPDQIQSILNSWAPVTETSTQSLAKANTDTLARFHRNRLGGMGSKNWGGKMTMIGNPVKMAANSDYMTVMSDDGHLEGGGHSKTMRELPSDMAVYLSGAFIDGKAKPMPNAQNFADEDFDGWSVTGGIEHRVTDMISVGASLSYSKLDAAAPLGQTAESDHFSGSLYGQVRSEDNLVLDGLISLGSFGSKTSRTVAFPANNTLTTDDNSFTVVTDLQVSKVFEADKITIAPHVGFQLANINFGDVTEQGGLPALTIHRENYQSTQGRAGVDIRTNSNSQFQARLTADLVREIGDLNSSYSAGFTGSGGVNAPFLLFGSDKNWAEVGAGVAFYLDKARIDLSADTTLGRSDIEAQTYRAGVTLDF